MKQSTQGIDGNLRDHCVVCHKPTLTPVSLNINMRIHYVEGVGQLCEDCWKQLYFQNNDSYNQKK